MPLVRFVGATDPRWLATLDAIGNKLTDDGMVYRYRNDDSQIRYLPIQQETGLPPPVRRIVLAWRRSFPRYEVIAALRNAIYACELPGVTLIH